MKDLCLWTGPVSANQVANVQWSAPTEVITVGKGVCGQKPGDTKCHSWQSFTALAASLSSGEGSTKIDALVKDADLQGPFDRRVITGFSAGGAFLEGMLSDKATAAQFDSVVSLDSWYFGGSPPGLMKYVDRAVAGDALMVVTTSGGPDYGFVTPSEAIKPVLNKLQPEDIPQSEVDLIFAGAPMPAPQTAQRKGQLVHFGWGKTLGHTDHAKLVGPWLLEKLVSPYLVSLDQTNPPEPVPPTPLTPGESGTSWLWWLLGGGAALAAGWYGGAYAKRWWRNR